jgi:hypothetical protein
MSNLTTSMTWAFFEAIYEMSLTAYPYKPDFINQAQNHLHYTVLKPVEIGRIYKTTGVRDERVILVPTHFGVIPFFEYTCDGSVSIDVCLPRDYPHPEKIFDLLTPSEYVIAVKRLLNMVINQNDQNQTGN